MQMENLYPKRETLLPPPLLCPSLHLISEHSPLVQSYDEDCNADETWLTCVKKGTDNCQHGERDLANEWGVNNSMLAQKTPTHIQ